VEARGIGCGLEADVNGSRVAQKKPGRRNFVWKLRRPFLLH